MEIRVEQAPDLESIIMLAALNVGAHVQIGWTKERPNGETHCRFKLMAGDEMASSVMHDSFIAAVFETYPDAVVRTGRAIYENKEDFESQLAARSE